MRAKEEVDDAGMELSEGEEPITDEDHLFFIDTSAMTAWPVPTTQYITAVEQSNALGASPDSELDDEPPYDPDADYTQRGTKQCFNCMSTSHIVPDCPYKRDPQYISLARADYGSRGGNTSRPVRFHEAEEMYKQRMEFNQTFEPGFVRGGLMRRSLGLNEDYNGGNEDLPWYFAMCDWGYPPGWVSDVDPRVKVVERINSTSEYERADGAPLLFIYEGDGPGSPKLETASLDNGLGMPSGPVSRATEERSTETLSVTMSGSPTLAPTTTSAEPPTVATSAQASSSLPTPIPPPPPFPVDDPPPPPDFPPPTDDLPSPSPPPPDSLPFPPRRWAHYRTTLFQSERLPISLVSRPLPALDIPPPPPPPPSSAPPLPPSPPPLPLDPPPPPPSSLTEQEKRRMLWEQIVAAQSSS